jgi:hypothetical protein
MNYFLNIITIGSETNLYLWKGGNADCIHTDWNCISDIMVSILVSNAVHRGFKPDRVKPKTIKLVFTTSLLNMQH